jgi:hypothetical protein
MRTELMAVRYITMRGVWGREMIVESAGALLLSLVLFLHNHHVLASTY